MLQFGIENKRTYHDCRVYSAGHGKKIKFKIVAKNRKADRKHWIADALVQLSLYKITF